MRRKAGALSDLIDSRLELSPRSSTRLDPVRAWFANDLEVDESDVRVKYFADQKNFRNRFGEALRHRPLVLVALLPDSEHFTSLLDSLGSRIHLSAATTVLILAKEPKGQKRWVHRIIVRGPDAALELASKSVPETPTIRMSTAQPKTISPVQSRRKEIAALLTSRNDWSRPDLQEAITAELQLPSGAVRSKAINDQKNLDNRIWEAIGVAPQVVIIDAATLRPQAVGIMIEWMSTHSLPELALILGTDPASENEVEPIFADDHGLLPEAHGSPDGSYAPSGQDERQRIEREIAIRRGQEKFRRGLTNRYGVQCCITGCTILEAIEAAHISPYRSKSDHHVSNGLLLRADIHKLYDLYLLSIDPSSFKIRISPYISKGEYAQLDGRPLQIPKPAQHLSADALGQHWARFKSRLVQTGSNT